MSVMGTLRWLIGVEKHEKERRTVDSKMYWYHRGRVEALEDLRQRLERQERRASKEMKE